MRHLSIFRSCYLSELIFPSIRRNRLFLILQFRGSKPVTDLKKVKSKKEVADTLSLFLGAKENIRRRLVSRLVEIRTTLEQSQYFKTHEVSVRLVPKSYRLVATLLETTNSPTFEHFWLEKNIFVSRVRGFQEGIVIFSLENLTAGEANRGSILLYFWADTFVSLRVPVPIS